MPSAGRPPVGPTTSEVCGHVPCGDGESCCFATLECFDPVTDPEACAPPPDDSGDPQKNPLGLSSCASNAHCDADTFCWLESSLCAGTGHCYTQALCPTCEDDGSGFCRVCACDGNTYPTTQAACLAGTFGRQLNAGCGESVGVLYADEDMNGIASVDGGSPEAPYQMTFCGSSDQCPREGDACCAITGICYPKSDPGQCAMPPPGTTFPCTSNAQCWYYEYCAGTDGCDTPGGCAAKEIGSEGCGELFDPVCGCNGIAYTSPACAIKAGTRVASQGECP